MIYNNAAQWIAGILAGKTLELIFNFRNETSHSAKGVKLKKHSSSEAKAAPARMPVIQRQYRGMEHRAINGGVIHTSSIPPKQTLNRPKYQ